MENYNYEKETQQVLRRLGVNGSYLGYWHTTYGVLKTIEDPSLTLHICKGLYVEVATKYNSTIPCIERNIRTVIRTIWDNGNREFLNEVLGCELTSKPNNSRFIDGLAFYVSNLCDK